MQQYHSNGKLLLTGEYAILDGAKSLALPTRKGQSLLVEANDSSIISWQSLDKDKQSWFQADFKINDGEFSTENSVLANPEQKEIARRLQQILKYAYAIKPENFRNGYDIKTLLEFNRKWGLGTSSTLINNIANWLDLDAYKLLEATFGGSGYDIAAANNDHPISFQLTDREASVFTVDFDPPFKNELFFVYLNRKQNSREAIAHYRKQSTSNRTALIEKISGITEQVLRCDNLIEFKMLLKAHEILISKAIATPRIQDQLFPDYKGFVKSLGGWGGDFVMATGDELSKEYFRNNGYRDILSYSEMIK
ncbi:GYDIA family GHMP kinase [Christiangramia portivictoriae]|uniref:GYDIA family GHMP kinase n=1 Tax=Christiangramia portivictoriae TaxID=326069 RepID=UPI00040CF591|nr:GYDIA family GHMP kinase [Christiangramia portivictoriae]